LKLGKKTAMNDRPEIEQLSRADLIALVETLRVQNRALQSQNEALQSQVEALRAEMETLKRGGPRQAAPFSKGKPKADPKPPGRKKGQGLFTYRRAPHPVEITEPPVDVPVRRACCLSCGGALIEDRVDFAFVTDLPPVVKPLVREYRVSVCRCEACGERVRGEHPDLAPGQWGASAHRLGARLKAVGHALHYDLGVPMRKVPELLRLLCGVRVTQSALTQDALRQAERAMGEAYRALREGVKDAPRVNTDDTGWRIGGETAHLMAFATEDAVVYQIRTRHRNEEVREVVPADYPGVMGCDRGKSYDAEALRTVKQQKCLGHILRSLSAEIEADPDNVFARTLKEQLGAAHALWRDYRAGKIDRERYDREGAERCKRVTLHLIREDARLRFQPVDNGSPPPVRNRVNQRLLEQIGAHHERGHLLRFLSDPSLEPTNNRAERALRGAVIARKVSHCSKNERGANAYAAFVSVIRTARQTGCPVLETLAHLLRPRRFAYSPP
jgi:transposase